VECCPRKSLNRCCAEDETTRKRPLRHRMPNSRKRRAISTSAPSTAIARSAGVRRGFRARWRFAASSATRHPSSFCGFRHPTTSNTPPTLLEGVVDFTISCARTACALPTSHNGPEGSHEMQDATPRHTARPSRQAAARCCGTVLARVSGGSIGWTFAAHRVQPSRPSAHRNKATLKRRRDGAAHVKRKSGDGTVLGLPTLVTHDPNNPRPTNARWRTKK